MPTYKNKLVARIQLAATTEDGPQNDDVLLTYALCGWLCCIFGVTSSETARRLKFPLLYWGTTVAVVQIIILTNRCQFISAKIRT